jgi:hypothetical protein
MPRVEVAAGVTLPASARGEPRGPGRKIEGADLDEPQRPQDSEDALGTSPTGGRSAADRLKSPPVLASVNRRVEGEVLTDQISSTFTRSLDVQAGRPA